MPIYGEYSLCQDDVISQECHHLDGSVRIRVCVAEEVAAKKKQAIIDKENLGSNSAPIVNFSKVAKSFQRQGEQALLLIFTHARGISHPLLVSVGQ